SILSAKKLCFLLTINRIRKFTSNINLSSFSLTLNFYMMAKNLFVSESKFIERSRSALANAQTNEVIKLALAEYGMGAPEISAGLQILNNAIKYWEDNKQEVAETTIASSGY